MCCHPQLTATWHPSHVDWGVSHRSISSSINPPWLSSWSRDRSRNWAIRSFVQALKKSTLGSDLRSSQRRMGWARGDKLSVFMRCISLWTSTLATTWYWKKGTVHTMGQHFKADLSAASVKCKKEMLHPLPGLELRLAVGEGGGKKSSLGRQNMENEIEQTAERLTEGAWWIYCYWP